MTATRATVTSLAAILVVVSLAAAQGKGGYAPPVEPTVLDAQTLTSMPVKELAVFKDGHAFVLHESELPTGEDGHVVLDTLPAPVLGTFWPYSAEPAARLTAVVAGERKVRTERTAVSVRELLEANPGAEVRITEQDNTSYAASIVGVPKLSARTGAGGATDASPRPPEPEGVILLKVHDGVRAVPLGRIRDVTFREDPHGTLDVEESRKLLTLQLDWGNRPPAPAARVGMVYLQKGVRWIPGYRVDIDGAGKAHVRLQATVINELVDLHDATVHLVIGVPSFAFKDTIDPMALQEAAAQLSQYFRSSAQMQQAFSNAIMTQMAERGSPAPAGEPAGTPDIPDASRHEDLFIFTIGHVTLRKGERMVVPVGEFTLPYEDVFVLDVPFAPPPEIQRNAGGEQAAQLARLLQAPKVMHHIRLLNTSEYPLTTAPALVLRDGRILAQSLMTYTPVGSHSDLELTAAVDVTVTRSEKETKRTPDAQQWENERYGRVDLAGRIQFTNHRSKPTKLEVARHVLGTGDSADRDGAIEGLNTFEDARLGVPTDVPFWWSWYNWPYWWHRFNGIARISWKLTLDPGQTSDLNYTWHYYWR